MVFVGEQREGERVLVLERLVALLALATDAKHDRVLVLNHRELVAESTGLRCAAGCVVAGVEEDNDSLATEIRKRDGIAVFIGHGELGGGVAGFQV